MNALFMKFYRFMRTTLEHWSTLTRNAAQAIPLKNLASRTGEGHSFQTLTVATLQVEKNSSVLQVMHWLNDWHAICDHWSQHVLKRHKSGRLDVWPKLTSQLCRNYPDISWINSNSVQFMETWPDMAHNIARSKHICMLHCDHWSQFLGLESHTSPKHLFFWGAPSQGNSIFGACFPDWGPGHRSSWRPRRPLLRATAPQPRRGRWSPQSAAASNLRRFSPEARRGRCGLPALRWRGRGAAGRTTEVVGMLSSTSVQPTNEGWMFSHLQVCWKKYMYIISSQTIANTLNKFHDILFLKNYFQRNHVYKCIQLIFTNYWTLKKTRSEIRFKISRV